VATGKEANQDAVDDLVHADDHFADLAVQPLEVSLELADSLLNLTHDGFTPVAF
jgi:hypothetical protein